MKTNKLIATIGVLFILTVGFWGCEQFKSPNESHDLATVHDDPLAKKPTTDQNNGKKGQKNSGDNNSDSRPERISTST